MDYYTDSILINLNSNNAIQNNGSFLSDVQFNFTGILKDNPNIVETKIQIQNAQIPYSFYNINVYNNILEFSVDGLPVIYTLTLTRGNYNANSLITELTNEFILLGITDITIIISPITGCLQFTKTTGSLSLLHSGSTIFKVLGFDVNTDYNSTGGIINAPYPLNLLGTLKLRIASDTLQTNNIDSSVGGSFNILATLPIEAGNFGLILYDNISGIQSILDNKYLDGFDIKILDDDNNLINFNNVGWSISLLINITRKRDDNSKTDFKNIIKPLFQLIENQQQINETPPVEDNQQVDETQPQDEEPNIEDNQNNINELIPEFDDSNDLDFLLYNNFGKI